MTGNSFHFPSLHTKNQRKQTKSGWVAVSRHDAISSNPVCTAEDGPDARSTHYAYRGYLCTMNLATKWGRLGARRRLPIVAGVSSIISLG